MSTISQEDLDQLCTDTVWAAMKGDTSQMKASMTPVWLGDDEDRFKALWTLVSQLASYLPEPDSQGIHVAYAPRDPMTGQIGELGDVPDFALRTAQWYYMQLLVAVLEKKFVNFREVFMEVANSADISLLPGVFVVAIKSAADMFRTQIAKLN